MKSKKAMELTLQTIVVLVVLLIVTTVTLYIFSTQFNKGEGILDNTQDNLVKCQENPDECFKSSSSGTDTSNDNTGSAKG